jgi:hypothetical protein
MMVIKDKAGKTGFQISTTPTDLKARHTLALVFLQKMKKASALYMPCLLTG